MEPQSSGYRRRCGLDTVGTVNGVKPQYDACSELSVGEAGEKSVLAGVLAEFGTGSAAIIGPGDDAAVLHNRGNTVVTTDTMIEGPDFRLDWHTGVELGWKLAAVNFSDIAAMGAEPCALTVAFACPKQTPVHVLREIARGIQRACDTLTDGCEVVGGDLATAPVLMGSVTALGALNKTPAVLRSGAYPGNTVAYAGQLGLSGLGLAYLTAATEGTPTGVLTRRQVADLRSMHPAALRAHLTPDPPLALGPEAAQAGACAMMDVSDGGGR